jgi:chromate transporter
LLLAELVAKGLLTRTELIDAIAVGHSRQGPFSPLSLLWAIKSMESQGIHFYAGDILPHLCLSLLNPMVKKKKLKPFATFLMQNGFHPNNQL